MLSLVFILILTRWPIRGRLTSINLEPHSAGDAIKVGVCYYIDAPEVITGRNNGCHDLWRIKSNETMKIAYVGPNKGAGLEMPNSKIVFQGRNSKYCFLQCQAN